MSIALIATINKRNRGRYELVGCLATKQVGKYKIGNIIYTSFGGRTPRINGQVKFITVTVVTLDSLEPECDWSRFIFVLLVAVFPIRRLAVIH